MYFLCFLTERAATVPNRLAPVKNYFTGIFQLTTDSALAEVGVVAPAMSEPTADYCVTIKQGAFLSECSPRPLCGSIIYCQLADRTVCTSCGS
jgi:hypothetical protein